MKPITQHQREPEELPGNSAAGPRSQTGAVVLGDLRDVRARMRPRIPGRPFVTVAYAQSVDGSITIARGQRCTLSGAESLRFTHALRANHDAILVGVGTVLADDPELRVRLADGPSPQPIIVDSRLSTPPGAKLLAQIGRPPWIGTTDGEDRGPAARRSGFEARGCRMLTCPAQPNGWVDLSALLERLHVEGIAHVMVEGGARIITSFLNARLVDYVVVTIAPLFLGGLSAVDRGKNWGAVTGPHLRNWVSERLGDDLVLGGQVLWPDT